MSNAILLHGKPGKEEYYDGSTPSCSNYHWFPWLQKQLIINDIKADTPEVPFAYDPKYALWLKEVERFEINPDTMLVGHSCGGGFWIRYLSEHKDLKVGTVVLVAPSLNPEKTWGKEIFDFEIDPTLSQRVDKLVIFNSTNDSSSIQKSVRIIREKIPSASYREFKDMGHFTVEDMPSSEFPELVEELLA
jgi:predicted alpha/beta hydrolase family esterase